MNEEKLKLPDFLLADLYKNSLVEIHGRTTDSRTTKEIALEPSEIKAVASEANNQIKYLGENAKNVTIVVNQRDVDFLNKNDLTFLTSILKACQLNLSDIAIVNVAKQQLTFQQLKDKLNCRHALLFDVDPSTIKLPFTVPAFQVQTFNECTIMLAPTLSRLNQTTQDGKLLKTKLWMSLKQMFGI